MTFWCFALLCRTNGAVLVQKARYGVLLSASKSSADPAALLVERSEVRLKLFVMREMCVSARSRLTGHRSSIFSKFDSKDGRVSACEMELDGWRGF